jgi:predicted glycosyl hydrolase (DUF1957 family)
MRAIYPAHLTFLDLLALIIYNEECIYEASHYAVLHLSHVTSCILRTNIPFHNLLSNTPNLCSTLTGKVKKKVKLSL